MQRPCPSLLSRRLAAALAAAGLAAAACGSSATANGPAGVVTFVDVAAAAGIDFHQSAFRWGLSADASAMMGSGVCWVDYDNDGWLDLFFVNSWAEEEWGRWMEDGGLPTTALYRNDRGSFTDVSAATGAALAVRGNGCVAADLDGDGWTDLYVTSARESALLWNGGDGTFTEGAAAAGADVYGWYTGAAAGDLNGDGRLELFVTGYVDPNARKEGAEGGFPGSFVGRRDVLYLNDGPGAQGHAAFREVGTVAGVDPGGEGYGLGALLADLDDDGDLDLYVANDTTPNRLYENVPWQGGAAADPEGLGFRLVEMGAAAGVDDDNSGMGVAGGDLNDDGGVDLLVTNLSSQLTSVYVNRSGLSFTDMADGIGIADFGMGTTSWGISLGDFDLDTDLDLMVANGGVPIIEPETDAQLVEYFENLTAQGQAGQFRDATEAAGLSAAGPFIARGSAAADYDNDGDLDLAINVVSGPAVLLENRLGGRSAVTVLGAAEPGTRVTATYPDGSVQHCSVVAGSSYLSSEDPRCRFAVSTGHRLDIEVRSPDGSVESRRDVGPGFLDFAD